MHKLHGNHQTPCVQKHHSFGGIGHSLLISTTFLLRRTLVVHKSVNFEEGRCSTYFYEMLFEF
jgi:hypothetical protein